MDEKRLNEIKTRLENSKFGYDSPSAQTYVKDVRDLLAENEELAAKLRVFDAPVMLAVESISLPSEEVTAEPVTEEPIKKAPGFKVPKAR